MDRRAWWATIHGVAELDTTEAIKHACPSFLSLLNTGHSCKVTKTNLYIVFKCKETFYTLKNVFICGMPDLLVLAYELLVAACGI